MRATEQCFSVASFTMMNKELRNFSGSENKAIVCATQ